MAKAQSFADKVKQKAAAEAAKIIKVVYSFKSPETGAWRFAEKFVSVAPTEDELQVVDREVKNGKAQLEKN